MSVFEQVKYKLEGHCCKCGDCCRFLYCTEPLTEWGFKFFLLFNKAYRRFTIIGKDENGLILACKLIKEDGICPDYENRPDICRDFPDPQKVQAGGQLYKRCTYKLLPEKTFKDFIDEE